MRTATSQIDEKKRKPSVYQVLMVHKLQYCCIVSNVIIVLIIFVIGTYHVVKICPTCNIYYILDIR